MFWLEAAASDVEGTLLRRRDLWQLVGLIALAGCRSEAPPGRDAPAHHEAPNRVAARPWSQAVHNCLAAACETILPSGDGAAAGFPGASNAGAIDFIAAQVAKPPLSRIAPACSALAAALDAFAQSRGAPSLAAAPQVVREAAIDALAKQELPSKLPQQALFRILRTLTLEGLLADPAHGGNRGGVGWTAIGLPAHAQPHHH